MGNVVVQWHGANAAPCREGRHRYLCDRGEPLWGQLPTTPKQPTVWILRTNRDREEGVWNLRLSVPVTPEKFQDLQTRYWGLLSGEAPQEGVNPPSLIFLRG